MRRLTTLAVLSLLAALLVPPTGASAQSIINSLGVVPSMVWNGAAATGTVTLIPDGEPTTVLLFSSDPAVAQVPTSVVAPAGEDRVTFPITTDADAPETPIQITAFIGNTPRQANMTVNAATPSGPSLSAVTVTPATVTGTSPATGRVRFTGAPDGALVNLTSSDPALVRVPAQTVVPLGSATGGFAVTTSTVDAPATATVTAQWFGITRTTTVTVVPGAPAPADVVTVVRARWRQRTLTIEATSSNPNAILSAHTSSGSLMFVITDRGNGRYLEERRWLTNVVGIVITVRSNLGGVATAVVTP